MIPENDAQEVTEPFHNKITVANEERHKYNYFKRLLIVIRNIQRSGLQQIEHASEQG